MKTEPIFDLLAEMRKDATRNKNWGVLRAVEKAENAALREICGVDLGEVVSNASSREALLQSKLQRKVDR